MKKFLIYFFGFVIVFFIAPAICTVTPRNTQETIATENKQEIEMLLKKELKKDRTKCQVEGFTKLNLLEMTRKNMCNNDWNNETEN